MSTIEKNFEKDGVVLLKDVWKKSEMESIRKEYEILDKNFIMNKPNDTKVISLIDNLLADKKALSKVKIFNRNKSKLFSINKNLDKTLELINQIE